MPDEIDTQFWRVIGMAKRLQMLQNRMHEEAVNGKHITVYADGEFIGDLNIDYTKEKR